MQRSARPVGRRAGACRRSLRVRSRRSRLHLPGARRNTGRIATAISAHAFGVEKLDQVRDMIADCDRIVAPCQWVFDALVANGAPKAKLTLTDKVSRGTI